MKFLLSFAMLIFSSHAFSQRLFYVYIQAEADQAFFVRVNDKVHSSSSSGWMLLPRLKDSAYQFSVGFPGNKWPEQRFSIQIKGRDHGFLLRNPGDRGWSLYDLQTSAVIMAEPAATGSKLIQGEERVVSPFTEILARAADDPSLRLRPVQAKLEEKKMAAQPAIVKEEVKPNTAAAPRATEEKAPEAIVGATPPGENRIRNRDRLVVTQENPPVARKEVAVAQTIKSTDSANVDAAMKMADADVAVQNIPEEKKAVKEEVEQEKVVEKEVVQTKEEDSKSKRNDSALDTIKSDEPVVTQEAEYKKSVVTKRSESSTSEGFGLTFIDDFGDGNRDTIRIVIPNPKRTFASGTTTAPVKQDPKFLDIAAENNRQDTEKATEEKALVTTTASTDVTKTKPVKKCGSVASENDFLRLRKKMAGEKGDDGMIAEATKAFRSTCYSTIQLKYLSVLFLNDHGKFKFFQAAQPYVSDPENFQALSAELKEEYYITRFKGM